MSHQSGAFWWNRVDIRVDESSNSAKMECGAIKRIGRSILRRYKLASWVLQVCLCLILILTFARVSSAQAKAITLKSGLVIEGLPGSIDKISVTLEKPDGLGQKQIVLIDDGLTRRYVSLRDIANVGESALSDTEIDVWQRLVGGTKGFGTLLSIGPFDKNGHRTLWIRDVDNRQIPVVQGITKVNPRWVEVGALVNPESPNRKWTMRLATSDLPPNVLRNILHRTIIDPQNVIQRMEVVEFYVEAEQYRRAIEELVQIERDLPDARDNFKESRQLLRQSYGRKVLDEIRFRDSVGQHELSRSMAKAIDIADMAGQLQEDYRDFLKQNAADQKKIGDWKEEVISRCQKYIAAHDDQPAQQAALQQLIEEIESDLRLSNIERLATYQSLLGDGTKTEGQLLSLAVSGWIMGSSNTTENFAESESLFIVRDLVTEYLSDATAARRVMILKELEKYELNQPVHLSAIILNMLPPKAPHAQLGELYKPVEAPYTGEHPLEFEVTVNAPKAKGGGPLKFRYLVHLPPQYDPYRKYPCIMTLRSGNPVEEQLERWAGRYNHKLGLRGIRNGQAIRHGYIVVSLDWKQEGQAVYEYSAREHKVILSCMQEMLKKFSIDSDRFFLTGHGFGADAAYDVAVSHPDQFAGVIGIAGKIAKYPNQYFENEHLGLNVYSVVGEKDLVSIAANANAWNRWLNGKRFNRCMVVEYKGRLTESFREEFANIMEWCDVHYRKWPVAGQEFKIDCKILRPWDNYLWFIEFHGLPLANTTFPEAWPANNRGFNPLKISAKMPENQVNTFRNVGPKKAGGGITIWLAPEYIDFKKKILVSGRGRDFKEFVEPSRKILLEDVRRRGDRKRPFWAKVDLN